MCHEFEAPVVPFLSGSGVGALPDGYDEPEGRVGLLLNLGLDPAAPRDFLLAHHGLEARAI